VSEIAVVSTRRATWLFSRNTDLAVFGGSATVAMLAIAVGARVGALDGDTPSWIWLAAVLLVDVAHVHATLFRTYFDGQELKRRRALYTLAPLFSFVIAVALYRESSLLFWRCAAYLAIFHFVRQQYGWVALYRARAGETEPIGRFIDTAAIYAATLYPLLWWHGHLPRRFSWFVPNDLAGNVPQWLMSGAAALYAIILLLYVAHSAGRGFPNPGKDLVVATTALCWYTGIVALNSDFAFTVTNVLIHGVPYLALVYCYARANTSSESLAHRLVRRGPFALLGIVWVLAFVEEAAWDHTAWHEHAQFFGGGFSLERFELWLVPLLAVPQLTHYVLDGFIWRRRSAKALFSA
jgi:hypothetical protein